MVMQDIAATMLQVGYAIAGRLNQTGISLGDVCARPGDYSQRVLLHSITKGYQADSGDGITTGPEHASGSASSIATHRSLRLRLVHTSTRHTISTPTRTSF